MATRVRGLWFVQLLEYAIGFAVAGVAVNAAHPFVLALLASAVIVNAAIVNGPLSAFHVTSVVIHRWLGILIAVAAIAVAMFASLDVAGRLTLVGLASAEAFVSVRFGHGI